LSIELRLFVVNMLRGLFLLTALFLPPLCASAPATSFSFAGLSRTTTAAELALRYPRSSLSGNYMELSAADTHDHIYSIELPGMARQGRFRLGFERPESQGAAGRYRSCDKVEADIKARYGPPDDIDEYREELVLNRRLVWRGQSETLYLHCFRMKGGIFLVEALGIDVNTANRVGGNVKEAPAALR
jgi:hypothetical protein